MIETKGLTKTYRDGTRALKGVTLRMDKKVSVVLGQNGAGKTTMLRILSTQLMPTSGSATVLGYDVVRKADRIRGSIVSIPQEAEVLDILTPYEHLEMYLTAIRFPRDRMGATIDSVFRKLGLYGVKDKVSDNLSGGMKRKVFVSMALAANARLTFLDEPTLGLDPVSRLEVWAAIGELKGNVVLTTHYLDEAKRLGNEIILMDSGKISMKGTAAELLKPLSGIVRIDGLSAGRLHFRFGSMDVSYLRAKEAARYIDKGYEVRQPDLEDLFIVKGIK
jgi:ABC-2 type transport system ATP-binding protein